MLRISLSRLQNPSKNPSISILSSPFSSRRKKNSAEADEHEGGGGLLLLNRDPESPPRLLVVQPRLRPESLLRSKLSEALNLANSLEQQRDGFYAHDFASMDAPPHVLVQNPAARSARVRADTYFGHGTVDTIKCHLRALESENELDAVFVNTILSGIQQRNLEVALGKPVLDRVGLIIEIFHAHAETKEAKLQSELAALMYKRSRLVRVRGPSGRLTFGASGEAEVVSARGRGSGGRGFISGAGETELQLQRRRIHERRNHLLSQIEEVRRTRSLQRHARRRHGGSQGQSLATVAIVGYTNAGKSTLVSALSETDLYCDDRLFATVDPRLRSVVLPSGRKALLSDTVGFISDLPVQLVEAFHATLEEVVEADLLVHVLDSSAPNLDEQRSTVLQVLQQIGVSQEKIENMIEVWNKIDLLHKNIGDDETLNQDEYLSEVEEEENLDEDECQLEGEGEENLEEDECLTGGEARESEGEGDGSFSGDKFVQGKVMSELSSEEDMESVEDQHAYSHKQPEMTGMIGPCEVKSAEHLETSAVTGIGLQELLTLIDEKLNTQSSIVTRSSGPLDRKWRPSYTADTAK